MVESVFDNLRYPWMVIDADSLLIRSAVLIQEPYIEVHHKNQPGKVKEFPNKTEFYGHHAKKAGGWLAEYNAKRAEKGKPAVPADDFVITEGVRPAPWIKEGKHIKAALKYFSDQFEALKSYELANNYKILLGGGGNFRDDAAQILKYKGHRPPKPIFFEEVRQAVLKKFKRHIELVHDKEVDDQMAVYGAENNASYQKTGQWKYLLAYLDKDLKMIASPCVNYDDEDFEVTIISPIEAARFYGTQLLAGDKSTDNIQGLPDLHPDTKKVYGLPNRKGCGMKTAEKLLADCESMAEIFTTVCECYRTYYGDEKLPVESWRGEKLYWDWKDYLQENALLLFMNPLDNPLDYDVLHHMERMGVELDKVPLSSVHLEETVDE